jgi:hypothetical protein
MLTRSLPVTCPTECPPDPVLRRAQLTNITFGRDPRTCRSQALRDIRGSAGGCVFHGPTPVYEPGSAFIFGRALAVAQSPFGERT